MLTKRISLPIAAEHNLKNVLGLELERETPFRREEVHWSFVLRKRDKARGQIAIDLFLAPRSFVDPFVESARSAGLNPAGIQAEIEPNGSGLISLDPYEGGRFARRQGLLLPLAAAACILTVIAVAVPFVRQHRALVEADATIASLREQARDAATLRQSIDQFTGILLALKKQREQSASALETLAAATQSLPDGTYLTALNLRSERLTMSGLSPTAAHLISLLSRTPGFSDPAFASPVVRSEDNGLETFTITLNVAPEDRT
jgi:general secretion pathway protein L